MVVLQETYPALGRWLACCFCFVKLAWPSPMTRLGLLLALRLRGRTRESLLLESTASRAQLRSSRTLGSLWVISCRQWVACSNGANLSLVVPGRLDSCGCIELATLQKRSSHSCSNSSVEEGLMSKCPRPIGPTYALGPQTDVSILLRRWTKTKEWCFLCK